MKLTDICEFQGGSQPPKNEWSDEPRDGYIRMLQIRDYTQENSKIEYIKVTNSTKMCEEKDILIARYGASIGKILTGLSGAYNVAMMKVIIDEKRIDRNYIYNFFKSNIFQRYIKNVGQRAAQAGFNKEELSKININLPNLDEQRKITQKIDKMTTIIATRKKQISELDKLIKSQFVEMFGDPILNPMNWEVKKLKDISNKIMSGNTPKGGDRVYVSSGIEFYRSQNVWKNRIEKEDIAYIDEETHKNMMKSSLKHNDLLITKTGRINTENSSLGRTAIYTGEDDKANINGHVYLVRLNEGENHEFVLRILISDRYREHIRSVCVGGIDKRQLNKEHIEDFPIIYPPKELQNEFTEKVKLIDKQKFEIQKSLKELQILQESLMDKYFGEM